MTTKTCEVCGGAFSVHRCRTDVARYCSYDCLGASKRRPQGDIITCTGCGEAKHADAFSWTTLRGERRRRVRCKVCEKAERAAKTAALEAGPPRVCTQCERLKPANGFYGMHAACKMCKADAQKIRRVNRAAEDKKAEVDYMSRYYMANRRALIGKARLYEATGKGKATKAAGRARRRALVRQAEGVFTGSDVIRLWHRQRGECATCRVKCGKRPSDSATYHVDHIMPLARGGSNWPHNLQILCSGCNLSKGAKTPVEFSRYLRRRADAR